MKFIVGVRGLNECFCDQMNAYFQCNFVREGAKNILRGGCLNLALLRLKIPTPPKNGNIGLDPP